jgi:hypothetical protein
VTSTSLAPELYRGKLDCGQLVGLHGVPVLVQEIHRAHLLSLHGLEILPSPVMRASVLKCLTVHGGVCVCVCVCMCACAREEPPGRLLMGTPLRPP